jgi:hypothetical protein
MKASGKIGSNGIYVSDNVEKRFETDIYIHIEERHIKFKLLGGAVQMFYVVEKYCNTV